MNSYVEMRVGEFHKHRKGWGWGGGINSAGSDRTHVK